MRSARILVSALLASAPLASMATDAPHDASNPAEDVYCERCHMGHNAAAAGLTRFDLCQTCHQNVANRAHGLPWNPLTTPAVPGTSGTSHNWAAAANGHGATAPAPTSEMGIRLDTSGGTPKLTCSVCHDQHNNRGRTGGTQYTSYPPGVAYVPGDMAYVPPDPTARTVTLSTVTPTALSKGYRIEIVTAGNLTNARFKLSNDGGKSWFGCSGANPPNVAYTPTPSNGCQVGGSVPLDTQVTVAFAIPGANFQVTDQWNFYVSYPFLRISNVDSAMCVVCHQDRNMDHTCVAGQTCTADGTRVFSHPVGESLNANGGNYDRGNATTNNVLDANGGVQSSPDADSIASNNLKLGANNSVHCMTCHSPHNADSNSLTELP